MPKSTKQKRRERVEKAIASLQTYINTYDNQKYYQEYEDETIIHDMLYGIGIALDEEQYRMADGYTKFKKRLLEMLQADPNLTNERTR